ncbi:MAG: prepilin peptidase [Patescibacteria group bacterium]
MAEGSPRPNERWCYDKEMFDLIGVFVFLLGLIVGSFLNVVIYRYNTGLSMARGRSMCLSCGKTLRIFELVPVLSFLMQKGKCSICLIKLSWQYPAVELTTGILFTIAFLLAVSIQAMIFWWIVFSLFVVISVYDLRHMIIPDGPAYALIALGFVRALVDSRPEDFISAFTIAGFFAILWLVSGGRWMGFGDAKLSLGIGLLLPFSINITAIAYGFWAGAIISIGLMIAKKANLKFSSEIPFAPFLVLGAVLAFLFPFTLLPL